MITCKNQEELELNKNEVKCVILNNAISHLREKIKVSKTLSVNKNSHLDVPIASLIDLRRYDSELVSQVIDDLCESELLERSVKPAPLASSKTHMIDDSFFHHSQTYVNIIVGEHEILQYMKVCCDVR